MSATVISAAAPATPDAASADALAGLRETIARLEPELVSRHADREARAVQLVALATGVASYEAHAHGWYGSVGLLSGRTVDEAADTHTGDEAQRAAAYIGVTPGGGGARR